LDEFEVKLKYGDEGQERRIHLYILIGKLPNGVLTQSLFYHILAKREIANDIACDATN
jgi:hypothetical protein